MSTPRCHFYEFGPFRINAIKGLLLRDGELVHITPKAFDILLALVENHGEVLTKDELMRVVWPDTVVEENNLARNISTLRKALGAGSHESHYVATIPGRGYRFVAQVRESGGGLDDRFNTISQSGSPPASADQTASDQAQGSRRWKKWGRLTLIAAAILVLATPLLAIAVFRRARNETPVPHFSHLPSLRIIPFADSPSKEEQPAFSHDGARMAFVKSDQGGNLDIYVKLIKDGEPLRLTTNPALDDSPAWAPDGNHIAFIRHDAELFREYVYVIPSMGGAERKVAELAVGISAQLSWAPDGEFLVVRDNDSPQEPFSIFLLSVEAGVKRKITSPPANTVGDSRPAFSPDGQTLAFIRQSISGGEDIYLVSINGEAVRRLTFDNVLLHSLAWTSDGREIVFSSSRVHTNPNPRSGECVRRGAPSRRFPIFLS